MSVLAKATLQELPATEGGKPLGDAVSVQFNPTTLRVQISNKSAGGQQSGSQARQRPGTGEITVSFDLVFDSADEGTPNRPEPVTRKTMTVEKFVRPRGASPSQQTPPRVEFRWGTFVIQGVMESANTDLDHFASDGTPLRAKVAVSIKGQNPEYRYDPALPPAAARSGQAAPPPGPNAPAAGAPGTRGGADTPAKVAQAMPGESLQQLAARHGLDPAAWRALADGVANPLALAAGTEIALPATLNLGAGITGRAGAGIDAGRDSAALPLVAAARFTAGSPDPVRQGQALARQGGVQGAIDQARATAQSGAVRAARSAFGLADVAALDTVPRPWGAGIPLRDVRGDAGDRLPVSLDPTVPRWEAMPAASSTALRALPRIRPQDSCCCKGGKR
jgi:LysM repeat protein